MDQSRELFRHTLIYGLIIGGVMSLYQFLLFVFGMTNNNTMASLVPFFEILGLLISIKQFRDIVQDGTITFGRAFTVGIYTSFFAGIVSVSYEYFFYAYLSPGSFVEMVGQLKELIAKSSPPPDQLRFWHQFFIWLNPASATILSILGVILYGSFFSLLMAFMLRKEIRRIG